MNGEELFTGIAVVIDDEIDKEGANIKDLIQQIEARKMPFVTYKTLPDNDVVHHFEGISFLLLDWELHTEKVVGDTLGGVKIPAAVYESPNIEFLNMLKETSFVPVFIFTNEDKNSICAKLRENNLYQDNKPNFIFVKNKDELMEDKLFQEIESWIKVNPSIYVIKAWEKEYRKAKNRLFCDFYDLSPSWPKILWDNFRNDDVNMSKELGEIITRNIYTRMAPFSFDESFINSAGSGTDRDEIRKVIQGERFIENAGLHADSIMTGDVFEISKKKTYINIRPDCDCIPDRNKSKSTIDDVQLYLIEGNSLSDTKERDIFKEIYGNFNERDSESIVFSMLAGKTYVFRFKKLVIKKWSEMKNKRIGRLLPPHITRIQQRYSLYLQRQGLPRTPGQAVIDQTCPQVPWA